MKWYGLILVGCFMAGVLFEQHVVRRWWPLGIGWRDALRRRRCR